MARSAAIARTPDEFDFLDALKLHLGAHASLRWWRQNTGSVPVRDLRGKVVRYFHAGPPTGAADMSGIVFGTGWRLEVELKSATGTRSEEQIAWGDFIAGAGGVYALVTYDPTLTMAENVAAATTVILAAIEARRSRSRSSS